MGSAMIREVTFPLETQTENHYRRMHWAAIANATKTQREETTKALANLTPCAVYLPPGWKDGNRFVVTLCRISPVPLDKDNVNGALKAVQDATASWIGIDDGHAWIKFKHVQQKCKRGYQGVRITIQCNEVGKDERHLITPAPQLVGEAEEDMARVTKPPPRRMPSFAAPPWTKTGPDEYDLIGLNLGPTPPPRISMKGPSGQRAELVRTEASDDDGPFWLYVPVKG